MFSIAGLNDSNRSSRKRLNFERTSLESTLRNEETGKKNKDKQEGKGDSEKKNLKTDKKIEDKHSTIIRTDNKEYFQPDKSLITPTPPKPIKKKLERWELPLVSKPSYFKCEFKNIIIEFINYDDIEIFFSNMNSKALNIYKGNVEKGFYYAFFIIILKTIY